jgi:simple sugar transport system ATP-binding protein
LSTAKVELRGIAKRFGETVALRGVDVAVAAGEIHGLLGENGAGKTTLMNILSGLYRPDRGEIVLEGRRAVITSPEEALRYRIGMVHQHFELIHNFTALENVLLGREGGRGWLRVERHRDDVETVARRFGLAVDLSAPVGSLSVGVQQKVEILKALYRGVDILILDEPTTMLTPQEVDALFATIRTLAAEGVTVIFITHKIREALSNCDRITVMRSGEVVRTLPRAQASGDDLVEMMIGQRLHGVAAADGVGAAAVTRPRVLEVHGLSVDSERGVHVVHDCTFTLASGRVVGMAGVAGNGQRELIEALVGLLRPAEGTVLLGGRDITRASVAERVAAGLVYIPEDRIGDGLLPGLSLAENFMLGLHRYAFEGRLAFDHAIARTLTRKAITEYGILARDENVKVINLSGGNIQKVIVGRAFELARLTGGAALLAMNPTRGLDVRATEFVRRRLLEFARAGGAVLLVSEDLDELLQLCDQMLVVYRGRVVADLARPDFDPYRIGALMAGTVPAAAGGDGSARGPDVGR